MAQDFPKRSSVDAGENASNPTPARNYALDWLRVLVILNLFPFHAAWLICFIPGFSDVAEATPDRGLFPRYVTFFSGWHMPLLFFIAGTTACLSLSRRTVVAYLKERVTRLLMPLTFFVIAGYPLMAYFLPGAGESRGVADFFGRFWPLCLGRPLDNWFAGGRPASPLWGHLWFVAYLLAISVLTLPLLLFLRKRWGNGVPDGVARALSEDVGALLPAVALMLIRALMAPQWPMFVRHSLIGDWTYFAYNSAAFLFGYMACLDARLMRPAQRRYPLYCVLAVASSAVILHLRFSFGPSYYLPAYTVRSVCYACLVGLNTWLWILGSLGLACRFLSHSNRFLEYFSRASYPVYILHLVVMAPIGCWIARRGLGFWPEFLLLTALSFLATIAAYELLFKRSRMGRLLMGMKP